MKWGAELLDIRYKDLFPILFIGDNNNIKADYVGPVPDFKYFKDITIDEYNAYKETFIRPNAIP
jgi:hypothetical protein